MRNCAKSPNTSAHVFFRFFFTGAKIEISTPITTFIFYNIMAEQNKCLCFHQHNGKPRIGKILYVFFHQHNGFGRLNFSPLFYCCCRRIYINIYLSICYEFAFLRPKIDNYLSFLKHNGKQHDLLFLPLLVDRVKISAYLSFC